MGEEVKQEEAPVEANKPEEKPVEEKKEEQPPAPAPAPGEEKKEEEATAQEEENKEEEAPQPPPPFVLFVDLHCVGCVKKIERSIMKIRGVEGVVTDMAQNQVTIKGVVEPQAVCDMIMKRTKRSAKVLSPLPANEGEPMPKVVTSQVSGLTTVDLNVNMHCEACAAQLKKKILKMRGVQTVETELSSEKVTVTGTMDANKLVEYVYRRTKKQARIVPQPEPVNPAEEPKPEEPKAEENSPSDDQPKEGGDEKPAEEAPKEGGEGAENKEDGGGDGGGAVNVEEETMKRMMYHYYNYQQPLYVVERIPPPQLFSDENPNACSIS